MSKQKYCTYCGAQIESDVAFCTNCGNKTSGSQQPAASYAPQPTQTASSGPVYQQPAYTQSQPGYGYGQQLPPQESANGFLVFLSFLIPILGLILFITKNSAGQKQAAKSYGIAALVGVIVSFVSSFVFSFLPIFWL